MSLYFAQINIESKLCYIAGYMILRSISNDIINVLFMKYDNNVKIQTSECSTSYSQTTTDELVMVMQTYWLVMVPFRMKPHNIIVIPHAYWLVMVPY